MAVPRCSMDCHGGNEARISDRPVWYGLISIPAQLMYKNTCFSSFFSDDGGPSRPIQISTVEITRFRSDWNPSAIDNYVPYQKEGPKTPTTMYRTTCYSANLRMNNPSTICFYLDEVWSKHLKKFYNKLHLLCWWDSHRSCEKKRKVVICFARVDSRLVYSSGSSLRFAF